MKKYLCEVQYDVLYGGVMKRSFYIYGHKSAYDKARETFVCNNVLSVQVTNADTGEIVILLAKD